MTGALQQFCITPQPRSFQTSDEKYTAKLPLPHPHHHWGEGQCHEPRNHEKSTQPVTREGC